MKEFFRDIISDNTIKLGFAISFLSIFITLIFVIFSYHNLPPFIPIFNQLPWGEQRLGVTISIFIPIILIFLILICNLVISSKVYKKIQLASRMLAITSLIVSIITFLFVLKTIQLVF